MPDWSQSKSTFTSSLSLHPLAVEAMAVYVVAVAAVSSGCAQLVQLNPIAGSQSQLETSCELVVTNVCFTPRLSVSTVSAILNCGDDSTVTNTDCESVKQ